MMDKLKSIIKPALGIIALLITLFTIDYYINIKINTAIQSEETIKKIQSRLSPSLIFDQNGSVLSDQGAYQFIEDIKVELDQQKFVKNITIIPKKPNLCPIITPLDNTVSYAINTVRGNKLDIIFELETISHSEPRQEISLFNLEFLTGSTLQFSLEELKNKEKVLYFAGRIVADGLDMIKRPGNTKFSAAMGTDPTYEPIDGDTYYDTRIHEYLVFSEGKWKKLAFKE